MRVLAEFVKELTEDHLLKVAPIILPQMCVMISKGDMFSSYTRARAVQVFRYVLRIDIAVYSFYRFNFNIG